MEALLISIILTQFVLEATMAYLLYKKRYTIERLVKEHLGHYDLKRDLDVIRRTVKRIRRAQRKAEGSL